MSEHPPRRCDRCGTPFTPKRRDQVRCGRDCPGRSRQAATDEPTNPTNPGEPSSSSSSSSSSAVSGPARPSIGGAAFYGLAGDVVRAIEPHTEADPAALLISYLVMLGNACGPQPSVQVGADWHPGRLFALLVGDSATGRKGTAGSEIERLFEAAAPDWANHRIERGIQSAEAIVARASLDESRDPRLLLSEFEFGRLLATMSRRPNLSSTLKEAWDGRTLSTITKDPANRRVARGAHISVLGHITGPELADRLTATDIASGFGNRFLYAVVERSKLLPDGGSLDLDVLDKLADRTAEVTDFAHEHVLGHLDPISRELCAYHGVFPVIPLQRSAEFGNRWADLYLHRFEDDRPPGVAGAVTSRVAAQVLRLAVVFALADLTETLDAPHLEAAMSLWDFCRASAIAVFGTTTGNRDADRVVAELRHGDLSRKDVSILFSRNKSARQLDEILATVLDTGLVRSYTAGSGSHVATVYRLKDNDPGNTGSEEQPQ